MWSAIRCGCGRSTASIRCPRRTVRVRRRHGSRPRNSDRHGAHTPQPRASCLLRRRNRPSPAARLIIIAWALGKRRRQSKMSRNFCFRSSRNLRRTISAVRKWPWSCWLRLRFTACSQLTAVRSPTPPGLLISGLPGVGADRGCVASRARVVRMVRIRRSRPPSTPSSSRSLTMPYPSNFAIRSCAEAARRICVRAGFAKASAQMRWLGRPESRDLCAATYRPH